LKLPVLDRDFFLSIPDFKRGYVEMYPGMRFGGRVECSRLEEDAPCGEQPARRSALLFSGGVDAFASLTAHLHERPVLITLWGSDVGLDDAAGWGNVKRHTLETARRFGLDAVFVKSEFRTFIDERALNGLVRGSGEQWWHGFQHGIGLIGHCAPIARALNISTQYIASSFTAREKGRVTCASDPSIDGNVRFCGCRTVHDGYDFPRQEKVRRIVEYVRSAGVTVNLRVCWISAGGTNCCRCEKCYRTMFALMAEGADPKDYGFAYTAGDISLSEIRLKSNKAFGPVYWRPIVARMAGNPQAVVPDGVKWLLTCDPADFKRTLPVRAYGAYARIRRRCLRLFGRLFGRRI